MIINTENNTSVVSFSGDFKETFLVDLDKSYDKLRQNNIILDLLGLENINLKNVLIFHSISNTHRESRLSFVIVAHNISFDDLPEDLIVVPTLLEAKDIIDMEEMERDLGLDELDLD